MFDSALTGQFTKIVNFTPKQHDKIVLSETDFGGLGPLGTLDALKHFDNRAATHGNPEIVYTHRNGFHYSDANGCQHGGLHHFATPSSHPLLTNASFIVEA